MPSCRRSSAGSTNWPLLEIHVVMRVRYRLTLGRQIRLGKASTRSAADYGRSRSSARRIFLSNVTVRSAGCCAALGEDRSSLEGLPGQAIVATFTCRQTEGFSNASGRQDRRRGGSRPGAFDNQGSNFALCNFFDVRLEPGRCGATGVHEPAQSEWAVHIELACQPRV